MTKRQSSATDLPAYIAEHNKTHIIFDFDATLMLLNLPWDEWGDTMRDEMRAIDPELWNLWEHEHRLSGVQNGYIQTYGDKAKKRIIEHNEIFEHRLEGVELHDELIGIARDLSKKRHLLLWSSNVRSVIEEVLNEHELHTLFDKVVTRNDVDMLKPDPEGFKFLRDPKVPKSKYLLVGDSSNDRGAAKAAGIYFYHIDYFNQGI